MIRSGTVSLLGFAPQKVVHCVKGGTSTSPQMYTIFNTSTTDTVYLGDDSVTIANGLPLLPEQYLSIPLLGGQMIYGTTDSVVVEVRMLGTLQQATFS